MESELQRLYRQLSYEPETGVFTRLVGSGGYAPGTTAGFTSKGGYVAIGFGGRRHPAHRLAWFYCYGVWPSGMIDHINGDPQDNRIVNLREADDSLNQANRKLSPKTTSGLKGVTWNKRCRKWQAAVKVRGKNYHLGLFVDPQEAHQAYLRAATKHFGEFARPV